MADYYPLLGRAVAGLQDNSPENRAALYDRARSALLAQLQGYNPPLAEADITRERLTLEDAVRRLEDEFAGLPPLAAPIPAPAPRPVPPPEPETYQPEPEPDTALAPSVATRPRIPPKAARPRRSRALWIVLAVLVPVTAAMGFLAYSLNRRDLQADAAAQRPAAAVTEQQPNSKVTERLGGDQAASPSPAPDAAPATPNASPAPSGNVVASLPDARQPATVAVAQRAVLLQENPANAQDVISNQGSVAWRVDNESPGPGQPLDTVIKAGFDFPDQKLHGEMIIRRNTDSALPASHTVEIQFRPEAGSPVGNIKAVGLIEARENEQTRGVTLGGSPFPVSENFFLIGLTNAEPIRSRNLQLLRERDWFYLEIQMSSGRRGALLLERGDVGKRVFAEALDSWQQ